MKMTRTLLATAAVAALFIAPAAAQNAEWTALVNKAKGQELNLSVHPTDGQPHTVDVFKQRFPDIKVNATLILPSAMAPRVITEQRNNIFAFDSWWGGTPAMVTPAAPAGVLAPITDYFVLPEVKDLANWNAPQYLWATDQPLIFLHTNYKEEGIFYNSRVIRDFKVDSVDKLLDPRLKGKITVRDPSRPSVGTAALAGLIKQKDEAFVRRIFSEQAPLVIENGRQADDTLLKGDAAVLIGGNPDVMTICKDQGGCESITKLPYGGFTRSLGVAVFKNAPHPDTTKVWVNWLLSKEGQSAYVEQWAKFNDAGAMSMRKDVPPHPRNLDRVPDYNNMGQYLRTSVAEGSEAQAQVVKIYNEIKNK
jgi:ABC-type Fe3+ transport system substrate-binding protein